MKPFYVTDVPDYTRPMHRSHSSRIPREPSGRDPAGRSIPVGTATLLAPSPARIAMYDGATTAPRVEEVAAGSTGALIDELASRVYERARDMGGSVPYSVVREIAENFVHAEFREPVVSVLDHGNTLRFSDQGPGFSDVARALEPGYTTATHDMKQFIRGVGSGLPLVREYLSFAGGSMNIEGNLGCGAVVTVSVPDRGRGPAAHSRQLNARTTVDPDPLARARPPELGQARERANATQLQVAVPPSDREAEALDAPPAFRLTNRQKQVLALVMDMGAAGPSLVAKELSVGLSTAYRDLARLEALGLIVSDEAGKREITDEGTSYLDGLLHGLF